MDSGFQKSSDEAEFLHSLATPLSTAIYVVDLVLEEPSKVETDALVQLTNARTALEVLKSLLERRRENLGRSHD